MVSSSETRLLIKENNNTKPTLNVIKPVPQHFKRWLASLFCWAIVSFMANVVQLKQYKLLYGKNSLPTSPYWCVLIFVAVLSCSVSASTMVFTSLGMFLKSALTRWELIVSSSAYLSRASLVLNVVLGSMIAHALAKWSH